MMECTVCKKNIPEGQILYRFTPMHVIEGEIKEIQENNSAYTCSVSCGRVAFAVAMNHAPAIRSALRGLEEDGKRGRG